MSCPWPEQTFGVVSRDTKVFFGSAPLQFCIVAAGAMVKVCYFGTGRLVEIKIFDGLWKFDREVELYCVKDDIIVVGENIWRMAIAIENRRRRMDFVVSAERTSVCERWFAAKTICKIYVEGTDHHVNGIFECNLIKIGRTFGSPGLFFFVKILKCLQGTIPDNAKHFQLLRNCLGDTNNTLMVTADYVYPYDSITNDIVNMSDHPKISYSSVTKTPAGPSGAELSTNKVTGVPKDEASAVAKSQVDTFRSNVIEDNHFIATKPNIPRFNSSSTPTKGTIFNINEKDVVIIEQADIDESTKNHQVTVVDPHRKEMDLCDMLHTDWPQKAGPAGEVLNGDRSAYEGNKRTGGNRNKSPNIVSHVLSSTKEKRTHAARPDPHANAHYDNVAYPQLPKTDVVPAVELAVIPNTSLEIGSMVQVATDVQDDNVNGVIRWIGIPPGGGNSIVVGVELEDSFADRPIDLTDGTYHGKRLFKCQGGRGLFVHPDQCANDTRFGDCAEVMAPVTRDNAKQMFGGVDCPVVSGRISPIKIENINDLNAICGSFKGIQGHHNSCYLDATLFSMFAFTNVFDALIYRERNTNDSEHYDAVKTVLRDEVVNPLRKNTFVRADRVLKLRELLEETCSIKGLTSEEKDPEEFINILLAETLKAEPFLKLNSGQEAFCYQLFVDKDERLSFPTVQQLFDQSFLSCDIKLQEVPSCFIIQMPRFGKSFKMYPRILPSSLLDVTDVIENSPRQCMTCGQVACIECKDCFINSTEAISYCSGCFTTAHNHAKRKNHTPKSITYPSEFRPEQTVPRIYMELFAVVCIETSHYVSFVKAGSGSSAPWSFFDSMADRKGGQGGYNIPKMVSVPELPEWITDTGSQTLHDGAVNDKQLPELAKRLLCDAYLCMYQSRDVKMYK